MIEFHWWQAVVLGAVQGFTEFLPISSSGHLALAHVALGLKNLPLSFDVLTHMGTLAAVGVFFWPKIKQTNVKYWFQVCVATIPAVVIGLLAKDAIEATTYSRLILTAGFLISALFLFISQKLLEQEKADKVQHPVFAFMDSTIARLRNISHTPESSPTTLKSFMIGVMQALALLPSVSRSGATLLGALIAGLPREEAFTFIFLMSIPAILGANILDFVDVWRSGEFFQIPWGPYLLGTVIAGFTGFLSLRFFRVLVTRSKLTTFAWYLVFVAFLSFFIV